MTMHNNIFVLSFCHIIALFLLHIIFYFLLCLFIFLAVWRALGFWVDYIEGIRVLGMYLREG